MQDKESSNVSNDVWVDDRLGRKQDTRFLIDFLNARYRERRAEGRQGAYVLNLYASCGEGKTFFLDRMRRQLVEEGHLVAYVNAWRDDADGEPMTAVMAELRSTVAPFFATDERIKRLWNAAQSSRVRTH